MLKPSTPGMTIGSYAVLEWRRRRPHEGRLATRLDRCSAFTDDAGAAACIGQSVPVSSWFARLDLSSASAVDRRVVQKVSDLLDHLQPARLDPAKQTVEVGERETWVTLRHDSEPELEIRFVLIDGWVNFYGVMGHDEAYSDSSEEPDAWESETIEILADLLLADYTLRHLRALGEALAGRPHHRGSLPQDLQLRFLSSAAPTSAAMGDARRDPQRVIRMSRRQTGGLIPGCTRVTPFDTKPDPPNPVRLQRRGWHAPSEIQHDRIMSRAAPIEVREATAGAWPNVEQLSAAQRIQRLLVPILAPGS